MQPTILNLTCSTDWTSEVRTIWEELDWEMIRSEVAATIPSSLWLGRRDSLALIALVPASFMEQAAETRLGEGPEWLRDCGMAEFLAEQGVAWHKRQIAASRRGLNFEICSPTDQYVFADASDTENDGLVHSPHQGRRGLVESFGAYVNQAQTILEPQGFLHSIPQVFHKKPAIFLCPERILEIYAAVVGLSKRFKKPTTLACNPTLVNLKMVLLHQLGHHFFPVHRACAGLHITEGLANLFCEASLNEAQRAWLLYHTWHLRSPAYSAYRPLSVLAGNKHCREAISASFLGQLDAWKKLPNLRGNTMCIKPDSAVAAGLLADGPAYRGLCHDLRQHLSEANQWFLSGKDCCDGLGEQFAETASADLVFELYSNGDSIPCSGILQAHFRDIWSSPVAFQSYEGISPSKLLWMHQGCENTIDPEWGESLRDYFCTFARFPWNELAASVNLLALIDSRTPLNFPGYLADCVKNATLRLSTGEVCNHTFELLEVTRHFSAIESLQQYASSNPSCPWVKQAQATADALCRIRQEQPNDN